MQKYIVLAQEAQLEDGRIVKRIQAVRDFGTVKKGTLGGFVETVNNLSQKGNCWIADDAIAAGWSRVSRDALLKNRARLDRYGLATDRAVLQDDVLCDGFISAYGDCIIGHFSYLTDGVIVRDHATVMCSPRYSCSGKKRIPNLRDNVIVEGYATLKDRILMADNSRASQYTTIMNQARLKENAHATSHSTIKNSAYLYGNSYAGGHTVIGGRTTLSGYSFAHGHSFLTGKTRLLCNSQAGGSVHLENVTLSGEEYRV